MVETIGTNAGLVWNALDKLGKMDPKALKKATKLRTDKELYAAIGWLAKEGKLHFEERDGELYLDLISARNNTCCGLLLYHLKS